MKEKGNETLLINEMMCEAGIEITGTFATRAELVRALQK